MKKIFSKFKKITSKQKIVMSVFSVLLLTIFVFVGRKYDVVNLVSKGIRQLFESNDVTAEEVIKITKAVIYDEQGDILKEYEQQDVKDTIIKNAKVYLEFNIDTEKMYQNKKWVGTTIYHLPKNMTSLVDEADGYVYSDNEIVGTFKASSDEISFNFDEEKLNKGIKIYGNLAFYAQIDFKDLTHSDNFTLEFTDKVQYDIFIKLKEELSLDKKALEPVVDQDKATITFGYEVTLYSASSTHGRTINVKDILTKTNSNDDSITRSDVKIEWKDSKGNKKDIPEDNKLTVKDKKTIEGTLPPLEAGDEVKITYNIVEQLDGWGYGTFEETNKVTAKVYEKEQEMFSLEAEAKSVAIKFQGNDYYELHVDKTYLYKLSTKTDKTYVYPFEVKISSSAGTKGNDIKVNDQFTVSSEDLNEVVVENLKVYKVSGDKKEEITSKDYLKVLSKLDNTNDEGISTYKAYEGTLPALSDGEYYLINYDVKIIYDGLNSNILNNTTSASSSKAKDQASAEAYYVGGMVNLDILYSYYPCVYHYCGDSTNIQTYKVDININDNHQIIWDSYILTLDETNSVKASFYDYKTNQQYATSDVKFPIRFKTEGNDFYLISDDNKKVKMHSDRDQIKISFDGKVDFKYFVPKRYTIALKYNESSDEVNLVEKYTDIKMDKSCPCDSQNGDNCRDNDISNVFDEVIGTVDNKVTLKWKSTIYDLNYMLNNKSYYWSLSGPQDHYYTQEQVDNIKVYIQDRWGKKRDLVLNDDYTIEFDSRNNDNIEIEFKKTYSDFDYIIIESESTAIVSDGLIERFENRFYNPSYDESECGSGRSERTAVYVHYNIPAQAGDVLTKYNYLSDGTFKDKQTVTYDENSDEAIYWYYRVVINHDGTLGGDAVFTDTLPEGTELVQEPWKYGQKECRSGSNNCQNGLLIQYANINSDNENRPTNQLSYPFDNIEYNYDPETRKITLKIPEYAYQFKDRYDPSFQSIVLYYKVKYTGKSNKDILVKNKATLKADNADRTDSAQTALVRPKFFKSSGEYNEKNGTVTYYVKINDQAVQMLDGTAVDVVDHLYYDKVNSKLKSVTVDSVRLYELSEGSKGEFIGDVEYTKEEDESGIELHMKIPDSKALYLEYTYKFDFADELPERVDLSNEIYIVGQTENWAKHKQETSIYKTGIMVNVYTNNTTLDLVKVAAENYDQLLKGAVYSLERYDGSKWIDLGSFTTGQDGKVAIGEKNFANELVMYYNYLYRLKELKPPTGYALDKNYYYVYIPNEKIVEEFIPEGFDITKVVNKDLDYALLTDNKSPEVPNTSDNISKIVMMFIISMLGLVTLTMKKYRILKSS